MFDYLKPHDGPVVAGLEEHETVYAKNQPQYLPLRTLPGEDGNSAISRFHLTNAQRKAIAEGADIYLEILHYRGPLAPSRLMVMDEPGEQTTHFLQWWKAQTKGLYVVAKAAPKVEDPATEGRELQVGGSRQREEIDLRDLGFVSLVSNAARREIAANERRAAKLLTDPTRFGAALRRLQQQTDPLRACGQNRFCLVRVRAHERKQTPLAVRRMSRRRLDLEIC